MKRITIKDLEMLVKAINSFTGQPEKPYVADDKKQPVAQIGNYHLSCQNGGYSLHRMCNNNGGIQDVFRCGHVSARDLYSRMDAYMTGLENNAQQK